MGDCQIQPQTLGAWRGIALQMPQQMLHANYTGQMLIKSLREAEPQEDMTIRTSKSQI